MPAVGSRRAHHFSEKSFDRAIETLEAYRKVNARDSQAAALLAVLLYMMGMLGHKLIGLPAPVGMLFLAVLLKLANVVSPRLQEGSQMVYKFFRTAVTYPILFAVGVAITPWQDGSIPLQRAFGGEWRRGHAERLETVRHCLVAPDAVLLIQDRGGIAGEHRAKPPRVHVRIVRAITAGEAA